MNSSLAAQLEETFAGLPEPATGARPAKRVRKDKVTATVIPITPPAPQVAEEPAPKAPPRVSASESAPVIPVAEKTPRLKNWEAMPPKEPRSETRVWSGAVVLNVRGSAPVERENEPCIEQQLGASFRLRIFGNLEGLSDSEKTPVIGDMTIIAKRRPNGKVFLIVDFRIPEKAGTAQFKAFIRPASAQMKHLGAEQSRYYTNKDDTGVFIAKLTD